MSGPQAPHLLLGVIAWVAVVLIGASWQLATRWGVTTSLTPADLALLRYCIPALVLLPVLFRHGLLPRGVSPVLLACIVIGGGLPFGLLGMAGAAFAPASHMGALLPGSMPVFVAILCAVLLGERFGPLRLFGLASIVLGVGLVVASGFGAVDADILIGDMLFLTAGVLWAFYTVAFRKSGLTPWHGAALICFWSALLAVPMWLAVKGTALTTAPITDIAVQILAQGILAGLLGLAAFGVAIRHLGASVSGVSGAPVPALTAVGGAVLLNEPIDALTGLSIPVIALGIWVYAGVPGASYVQRILVRA